MIHFARYELQPRRRLSPLGGSAARHGALLRVDGGYADVHPWPELGDLPLDEQLGRLACGETTPLTARSLHCAAADAAARKRGVSLFDGLVIPVSHWPGADPPAGFDTVKLKSLDSVPDGVRIRVDFNNRLTPEEFVAVARSLPRDRIDFVEDPTPYDPQTWVELRKRTGLRLALDREQGEEGVDVLVVKPAIQEMPASTKEIVVTSYMDHPVGQLFAAHAAALYATSARCGIVTHVLYEENEFSERLEIDEGRLIPPGGSGIGFDDVLERVAWKRLA